MELYNPDDLNKRWAKYYDYCNAMVSLYGRISVDDAFSLIWGYESGDFDIDDFLNFLYNYQARRPHHNDHDARFLLYLVSTADPKQKSERI